MREDFYRWSLLLIIDEIRGRTTGASHEGCPPFGDEELTEEILVEWLEHRIDHWQPSIITSKKMFEATLHLLCVVTINDWERANQ